MKTLAAIDGTVFPFSPLKLLILQPTTFCNINCAYCYLPDRRVSKRMSDETVRAVFNDLATAPFVQKQFTVVWHAGEPLTVGLGFYQRALKITEPLAELDLRVSHSFQTNATLVDDEWCEFFKHPRIRVGVSLDGHEALHDANRRTYAGAGTHAKVMRGIECLQRNQIEFHVICVLTYQSLTQADAIFEFFCGLGLRRVCFNIDEIEGVNKNSTMDQSDASDLIRSFYTRFFELAARVNMEVREFDSLRRLIYSGHYNKVSTQCLPYSVVSVGVDGDYSTFSPELLTMKHSKYTFVFGNIHIKPFISMLDAPEFRRIYTEIEAGVNRCRNECEYYVLCGGGAPSNKVFENGTFDSTETIFCRTAKQAVIDVTLPIIERKLATEVMPMP